MAKTSKPVSLSDVVKNTVSHTRPGPKGFLATLDESAREELLELRRQFQAGTFGTLSALEVSRRVHGEAEKRGWSIVGVKEFALWLRR